jgi:hypothetical protein
VLPCLQVLFSSSLPGRSSVALSSEQGWRPAVDSRQQHVTVDLGAAREVSGLATLGLPGVGWIEAFSLSYSGDGLQWSTVRARHGDPARVFPANYDATSVVTQYLDRLVSGRFFRVAPARWHGSIGLRLELLGCYLPYPPGAAGPAPPPSPGTTACSHCPGLSPAPPSCSCPAGALYDGTRCVAAAECPCYVSQARQGTGCGRDPLPPAMPRAACSPPPTARTASASGRDRSP